MSTGVSNGSTTIPAGGSQPVQVAAPVGAKSLLVYNNGSNTVYFGGSTVTSSTGVPLAAGGYLAIDTPDTGTLYAAGTQNDTIRWLASGVGP